MAESHKFNAGSIDCVIYSSLCRLNVVRSGLYIDPLSQYAARAMIGSFYRDPSLKPPRGGMTPLIPDDVGRIITAMDYRDPKAFALAALFTFALSTGARGNSCGNVRLSDLGPIYETESGCILVVTIVKLKGRPLEKLQLSLAGKVDVQSPVDVVYWINQHLVHNFKVSLKQVVSKEVTHDLDYNTLLWPYTTDSMTQYLKSRLETAGLSSRGFGFHSFRSGFLASCLIQGEKRGEPISDVLVRCALVTGWKALGSVEFSYIREAARRRILPTNMIGITTADPFTQGSTIEDQTLKDGSTWKHANSLEYHGFQTSITPPKRRSNLFRLKYYLSELLWVKDASSIANQNYVNSSYHWCLREFGKQLFESGEVTEEEKARFKSKSKLYQYLGFQFLDKETASNPGCMKAVAEEMMTELRNQGKIKSVLPASVKEFDRSATEAPRLYTQRRSGRCRIRLEWAEWEDQRLLTGIEKGEWADQIIADLPSRNEEDLYFHVRNLNKKRSMQKLPLLILHRRRGGGRGGGGGGVGGSSSSSISSSSSSSTSSSGGSSDGSGSPTQQDSDSAQSSISQPHRRPPPLPTKHHSHQATAEGAREGGKRRSP